MVVCFETTTACFHDQVNKSVLWSDANPQWQWIDKQTYHTLQLISDPAGEWRPKQHIFLPSTTVQKCRNTSQHDHETAALVMLAKPIDGSPEAGGDGAPNEFSVRVCVFAAAEVE